MNEFSEAIKGLTDIPIALLSFVLFLLIRKKGKKQWSRIFLFVAVAGFLGAIVHTFRVSVWQMRLLWIVLYVFLFELVRRFALAATSYISGKSSGEKKLVYGMEAAAYLISVTVLFLFPGYDIYAFVVFAAILFVRVLVCLIKTKNAPKDMWALILFLVLPIALQALADFIPYAVYLILFPSFVPIRIVID